jgi:branched-chain amino acid transport system substrate-binding protein
MNSSKVRDFINLGTALALAFFALLQTPSTAFAAGGAPVKIGVINSTTGPEAPIGESLANGYKMAQEDLAAKGMKIEIVWEDDTGKPQIAMSGVEKLATRDKVAGIVGPYTSASANAVSKLADRYKVPLLIPAAAKEELTKQNLKYVFRLNAPASVYASVLIDAVSAVSKAQPAKTIAFIYENTDFGTSTSKTGKDYATKMNLKIVADEPYSAGSPDYRSTLTKIKGQNPDLIFMVSYVADAILLMRQAREIGLQPKAFLGAGAGFTTEQFAKEKDIANFVLSSTQWTPDVKWAGASDFATRYRAKYKKEPTYHAACAYEAMRIMGEVASHAAGDTEKARQGLRDGKWAGIMGDVKFGDYEGFTNQNNHAMLVEQIIDGKYVTVFPEAFASAKAVFPYPARK